MDLEKMYEIPAFELLPAGSTHGIEPDSYDSDMSYVVCDKPDTVPNDVDRVPNDVTTALPSSSQDLNLPDGTISLRHEHIKNILRENILLKEKMKHGNSVMAEQLNWHNQVYQTHEKYRDMIKNLTKQNEKLQEENQELEKKLEDSKQTVVICEKSNNIGDSSCVEDTLLQNSDLQSQISYIICKFSEEKTDVENHKKLLDTQKELHDLQENHRFVQNEYYNSLSVISILEEDKKNLTLTLQQLEASLAKITQEKQDKDLMFKRTSEELQELKASQEKSDELRKQNSERLLEMTATFLYTQKKLVAAEETVKEFKRTSEELEELKASQEKSDELKKQSSEKLSEMTITLADTQKKLEDTEKTVEELENTLKEMEKFKASHERSEEMRKESSEALSKVTATLTEVTATLTDNQKKLMATEEAVEKLENELKLKEEELKASQDAYKELTKQHTEKLEMLEVTQNKLVAAEEAAKNFDEVFGTLESEALKYKEELEKVQSSNRENMSNIDELKKVIASYSEEAEKRNAECQCHKENQKATELTLVKISEEQEQCKRVRNSLEKQILDYKSHSALTFKESDNSIRRFNVQYRCFSVSMLPGKERPDVEKGGKIIMPPSALDHLTRLNVVCPMFFKLTNKKADRETHCGVLEFIADEGKVYLPYWMMRNLLLEEGGMLHVEDVRLPMASFAKFQPASEDFLDISNIKDVLENALRFIPCLTTGEILAIEYNDQIYELCVLETKPGRAVTILECNLKVEFVAPIGYRELERAPDGFSSIEGSTPTPSTNTFVPFGGKGNRLNGKKKGTELTENSANIPVHARGMPDYGNEIPTLTLIQIPKAEEKVEEKLPSNGFKAFSGEGRTLRSEK